MEITIVGLPYYGYGKFKNTLVEGKVVSLKHDIDNPQSKTAVVIHFGTAKIGYVTGREYEDVLKVVHSNTNRGIQTLAKITEVRASSLRATIENYPDKFRTEPKYVPNENRTGWVPVEPKWIPTDGYLDSMDEWLARKPDAIKEYLTKEKEITMFDKIVNTNTAMAQSAAFLEAGRIANNTAAKFVANKSPLMVKGYVDTAFGKLLIANAAAVAANKFRPTDKKLARLANAMITQAYQEVYQLVDIEKMLNEMLSSESVKAALSKLDNSNEYAE